MSCYSYPFSFDFKISRNKNYGNTVMDAREIQIERNTEKKRNIP